MMCLNELHVSHEISLYYEEAYKALRKFNRMYLVLCIHLWTRIGIMECQFYLLKQMKIIAMVLRLDGWPSRLSTRQEKHKFLLVFSDGEPSAFGYDRNGILDTAEAVMEAEKKGFLSFICSYLLKNQQKIKKSYFP